LVDMDGNGLLDITVAIQDRPWIVVLPNNSTSGSLNFSTQQIVPALENSRSVRGGDLNGDGKPDLAYTETATDQIAIQLNRNCIAPVLEPQDGLGICDQLPYQLSVTKAIGVDYEWESSSDGINFASVSTDSTFTFTTNDELFYRVKVTTPTFNGLSCTVATSNSVEVVRPDGFVPSKPAIINKNPAEPVCFGGEINLAAESVRADYFWTGPNGFSSSDVSPTITNVTKVNEGLYVLFVRASEENGGCVSDTVTTFIRVSEPDSITAHPASLPVFFEGGQVTLAVNQVDGQTYEWKYNDQVIAGATATSLTDNREGTYVAVTQNTEGCRRESNAVDVAFARPEIPAELCQNEVGQFVITPERSNGEEVAYRWIFEGNRAEGDTVSYQFTNSGNQAVIIEILESDGSVRDRYEQMMEVLATPELTVQDVDNPNLCPGAAVVLEASEGFASYQWNTESTER
ncbi:MAG: VCBS repeat-containing protein, partial [Bacteroidota bacterium]